MTQLMHQCAHGRPTCTPLVALPAMTLAVNSMKHSKTKQDWKIGSIKDDASNVTDPEGKSRQANMEDVHVAPNMKAKKKHRMSRMLQELLRSGGL